MTSNHPASEIAQTAPLDPLVIALGHVVYDAVALTGARESVKIRLLRIAEFPRFLSLLDKDEKLAEFLTGKPEGWAAAFTNESIMDIVEKGMDLNFTAARRWAERRLNVAGVVAPFAKFLRSRPASPSDSSAPTAV